jgi:hypothetical protein
MSASTHLKVCSWILASGLAWAGCGDGDAPRGALPETEADAEVPADYEGCDELEPFALGLTARGEENTLEAEVLEAAPAPPRRYRNDWIVQLRAADGSALEDVELTHARPFMPVHGHDGGIAPVIHALSEQGKFRIERLNFSMRGPWQVQLTASSPSRGNDYIVFHVCVME